MNVLSYFLGSRALTEEEGENIRLQIGRCDSMINRETRNLADEEAHLVLPANGGDWGEYKKSMKYIKNLEESVTYLRKKRDRLQSQLPKSNPSVKMKED